MEIERKWLLRRVPEKPPDSKYWIEQFYISTEPEIRLRRCMPDGDYENDVPYRMTLKGDGTLSRSEAEVPVLEQYYQTVLDIINLDPIQKHFLTYNVDGHKIEVSVILNDEKFIYAEVEFGTEEEALEFKFPWPEIVEKEVTEDPAYKMKNYWKRIRL